MHKAIFVAPTRQLHFRHFITINHNFTVNDSLQNSSAFSSRLLTILNNHGVKLNLESTFTGIETPFSIKKAEVVIARS